MALESVIASLWKYDEPVVRYKLLVSLGMDACSSAVKALLCEWGMAGIAKPSSHRRKGVLAATMQGSGPGPNDGIAV